jgi:hypothetical protein
MRPAVGADLPMGRANARPVDKLKRNPPLPKGTSGALEP